jgi:hypothetical protein
MPEDSLNREGRQPTPVEKLLAALERLPKAADDDTIERCILATLPGLPEADRDTAFALAVDMIETDAAAYTMGFLAAWTPTHRPC